MSQVEATVSVPAEQVQRLRQLTDLPWMECKRLLISISPEERLRYIASLQNQGSIQHDPIENDPAIRPLFLAAFEEARREVQDWHRQHIAELEQQSPAVASLFRSGRGSCHRIWSRIKELMLERHGIEWRSPQELNPFTDFD